MTGRSRRLTDAARWAEQTRQELASELRRARMAAGMTLAQSAQPLGWTRQKAAHVERGALPTTLDDAVRYASVLGLRVRCNAYPVGAPLRDLAQLGVIRRFRGRVGAAWDVTLEAPLPISGDLRAFDMLLRIGALRTYVEVITRLTDAQAQIRALQLKLRDVGAPGARLLVVVSDTAHNREALSAVRDLLAGDFPLSGRASARSAFRWRALFRRLPASGARARSPPQPPGAPTARRR